MRVLSILFFFLMLSACASPVNIDYDRSINFASYTTYSLQKKPVRVSADTRVNSSFMQQRVINEVHHAFTKRGFKRVAKNAELTIKYYLDIKQEIEVQDSAVSIGFGTAGHHSAIGFGFHVPVGEATTIDNLVLTLDVVTTKNNALIWRGSLGYSLYSGATPETYNRLIKDLVTEILENFPPK